MHFMWHRPSLFTLENLNKSNVASYHITMDTMSTSRGVFTVVSSHWLQFHKHLTNLTDAPPTCDVINSGQI